MFLSLSLILVLALLFTVAESARVYGLKIKAKNITQLGVESVFAEYNKTLLDRYDLFFYCKNTDDSGAVLDEIQKKWERYVSYNMNPTEGRWYLKNMNFYKLELKEFKVNNLQFAIEDNGSPFKKQAVQYMKDKLGVLIVEEVRDKLLLGERVWNQKGDTEDAQKKLEQAELEMENMKNGEKEDEKEDGKENGEIQGTQETDDKLEIVPKEPIKNNPLELLKEWKKHGILGLVVENADTISKKSMDLETVLSTKIRYESQNNDKGNMLENIYFNKYLLEKCSFYTKSVNDSVLDYEVEYILNGKSSDQDNLEGTILKLLGLREASNFAYLLTDGGKKTQAMAMASVIAGFTGMPPVIKGVQLGILLAWAFAESVGDIQVLLKGEKSPLIKTKQTWNSSLENLSLNQKTKKSEETGLTYEDYLEILLFLQKNEVSVWRMLDVIEKNVQAIEKSQFKMNQAIQFVDYSTYWEAKPLFFTLPFLKQYGKSRYQFLVQDYYQYQVDPISE